ncbi:hypothetical protein [uncultured Tateyamaria sp.]|uniref:hypothetical protein n=1 Tax=uncultured Tateyamaria sp. TaxID=455651 RepID=UPI002616FC3D|nr:hypothetical protein [uncultured Tateyamaria sp.]
MKKTLRNRWMPVSLLIKARLRCAHNPQAMSQKAYSFTAQSNITVLTHVQLDGLIQERRERGMSEELLAEFEAWHRAALAQ